MKRPHLLISGFLACMLLATASHADPLDERLAAARALLADGKRPQAAEKFEALKDELKQLLAKTPDDAHLNYLYGCVCMDGGFDDDAAAAFDKAIKADPKNAEYLTTRALLLEYQEKPADAVVFYQRAADSAPGKAESWGNLARSQTQAGQSSAANESLRKAIAIAPKETEYLGALANNLIGSGNPGEALEILHRAVALDPAYVDGYMNIGQLEQTAGHHAAALDAYEKGLKLAPNDYRAWAKRVQLCEALKQPKERDAAREKIFALWKAGKVDQTVYCREQFKHGKTAVMVFESFELTGDRAVRYAFHIIGDDGKTSEKVSLGSYETTTEVARKVGDLKAGERMFHLDSYSPGRHATLGMFRSEPTYEQTREMVVKYLDGQLKPVSSTSYSPGR